MNKKSNIIYSVLVFLFAFSFNSRIVEAYFSKSDEKVNTFTIAELKEVTYTYYYLDENDNEVQAQNSTYDNVFEGTQVTISNALNNMDCSSIKHYVNGVLYNSNTYTVNEDTTIKEVCELNRYTITYNLDGGTLNNQKTTYTSMTETFSLGTPTKEHYKFKGWTGSNGTTPQTNVTITKGSTGDKEYTANWKADTFEVTYKYSYIDENDVKHQLKSNEVITYENDYTITLADELDSTVDYDTVSYVINNSSYNNSTYTVNDDSTIEIVYTLNRYTITYNLNGGTLPEGYPTQYTSMTETFDLPTPTKNNNTFLGWGEDVSVSGSSEAISIATEMENGTVYDTGIQNNNTHIYLRTVSGEGFAMNVNYNNQDRVVVFTDDVNSVVQFSTNRTNWTTINNWIASDDGLYYQFFTLGNGGFNPTPSIVDPGITYNEFTTLVDGGSITIHHVENPYTVTKGSKKDIEVTAQWRANTYTVTFDANGGTGTMSPQTFTPGVSQSLTANGFTGPSNGWWGNRRFDSWNTDPDGNGTTYTNRQSITIDEDITLYAQWR